MGELIFVVHEDPEGGYTAHALGQSIVTCGDTLEELRDMVRDAVRCHFDPPKVPKVVHLKFIRDEVILV